MQWLVVRTTGQQQAHVALHGVGCLLVVDEQIETELLLHTFEFTLETKILVCSVVAEVHRIRETAQLLLFFSAVDVHFVGPLLDIPESACWLSMTGGAQNREMRSRYADAVAGKSTKYTITCTRLPHPDHRSALGLIEFNENKISDIARSLTHRENTAIKPTSVIR